MERRPATYSSVDGYIAAFPEEVQSQLQTLRATIRAAAPDAVEKIAYNMPAFTLHKALVYFAAYDEHIGLYPVTPALEGLEEMLKPYRTGKGTLRFPLTEPLPLDLITRIVTIRVAENRAKAGTRKRRRANEHPG